MFYEYDANSNLLPASFTVLAPREQNGIEALLGAQSKLAKWRWKEEEPATGSFGQPKEHNSEFHHLLSRFMPIRYLRIWIMKIKSLI